MKRLTVLALSLALLGGPQAASAIWLTLTAEQVQEALSHGKAAFEERRAKRLPPDDRDPAWEVELGPGKGTAYLWTPFNTLSREARRYMAIQRELSAAEVQGFLDQTQGRLVFEVLLFGGPSARFARAATARLEVADTTREPVFRDIHPGLPTGLPESPYKAQAVFHFPADRVAPDARVALVVTIPGAGESRFSFDLGTLR